MKIELADAQTNEQTVLLEIVTESHGVSIKAEGFSTADMEQGPIVLLETLNGKLRLVVWANINNQDPTHIIDLEQARESNRQ